MSGSAGKPVLKPSPSAKLAEFIGIMLGDGGMSRYQATVTLHHIDDLAYSQFVVQQIEELFGYSPDVHHRHYRSVINIVMSRIELVRLLCSFGLPIGDKVRQHIDIPDWIQKQERFLIPCVRGLVDTDGCVFTHRYLSKGKWYSYKKLSFTSVSEPLRESVASILARLGMHPRIGSNRDVRLDSIADMERYFSIIGSNNPKHLRRYAS